MDADRQVDQEHEKLKKQIEQEQRDNDAALAKRIQLRENLKQGADTPAKPENKGDPNALPKYRGFVRG